MSQCFITSGFSLYLRCIQKVFRPPSPCSGCYAAAWIYDTVTILIRLQHNKTETTKWMRCEYFLNKLHACNFVFAAQTGGQGCRVVVAQSIFGHVYSACVGVSTHQVGEVYASFVLHQKFTHHHECTSCSSHFHSVQNGIVYVCLWNVN